MTKIAGIKTTKQEKVREAKRAFILSLIDLSWKLAGAFMIPTLAGVAIDAVREGDGQAFTIAGVIVGFIMALLVIIKLALESGKNV